MKLLSFLALVGMILHGRCCAQVEPSLETTIDEEANIRLAENQTGSNGGLGNSGLTWNFDATYVFQGLTGGGITSTSSPIFSYENDLGNTFSSDLRAELDTEKAGWWPEGRWAARIQGRSGQSIVRNAGSVAAVNNEALFPNVVDKFDSTAIAVTELTYQHKLGESLTAYAGLLNTALGDENSIAGSALSHSHFLNFAMLYSLVEDATVPHTSLGSGIEFTPDDEVVGSFSVFGTQETAGENPFHTWHGTTFSTEWTVASTPAARAQTFGFLYGIDARRIDIAADPRLVIISLLLGVPIPTTDSDTWAFYYNAHQFIQGDEESGWGIFARFGFSDGNPNPVSQNAALGIGGVGPAPSRSQDRWGLGVFHVNLSDADLLSGLNVGDEVGGEVFYNWVIRSKLHLTLDAQVIDSALPRVNRTSMVGLRTNISF